ncbi:MAG: VWA domain-containing protein [Deinococcota bacterium]|nr:VWA domain-containing protein [Deinococcota bacterium]
MVPFGLSFALPWVFLGLLVWLVLPRRRGWGLRLLATALVLAALAQPSISQPSQRVALLVDVSESVGEEALAAARRFDFSSVQEGMDVIYFAEDAGLAEEGLATPRDRSRFLNFGRTDIARALQVARAFEAQRVLLISDGIESQGDALLALPGVPVDVYGVAPLPNTRLVRLIAPDEASPGETVMVTAVIESDQEAEVILRPRVGSEDLEPIRRSVSPGRTPISFSFAVEEAENIRLTTSLEVDFEQPESDDALAADIAVTESQAVLVVGDPAMAELLSAQGFTVVAGSPEDITRPFPYGAAIIRENSRAFTAGQLSFLEDFVRGGGGLMMTGGEASFGLGGWYRTAVEEILPVSTDLRTDVEFPMVATVVVFDRSTSMTAGRPTRISLARQGAIDLVELAHSDDLLGLITFDSTHEWHFRPRPATERGKREMLEAILRIQPQGGTIVGPAYGEAIDALRDTDAAIKHIILLTDGEFFDGRTPFSTGPRPDFVGMAAEALEDGITTTTIGTGEADFDIIERMAQAGGGRFYAAIDTTTLPQIFTSEALTTTRSFLREEPVAPRVREHPLLSGLRGSAPTIDAYIASSLRSGSEMLMEGLDGEPILAISRQGLGRTAALTTDLNAWAGQLGSWEELPGVLGTVVRWLEASPPQYSASVTSEGGRARVVVDAVQDGEYVSGERLEARYDGRSVPLSQTAPGRYEAALEGASSGGSVVIVSGSEIVARGAVNTPNPEFDAEGAEALLSEIARRSRGERLIEPGRYEPPMSASAVAIWPWLAVAGLLLFTLELVYRRFAGLRADA